jgi:hypothetical protein
MERTMKNEEEIAIDELYIEELGEVRGGIELQRRPLSMGTIGAEGVDILPWKPPTPNPPEPREPRLPYTTLALGEEGPSPWLL